MENWAAYALLKVNFVKKEAMDNPTSNCFSNLCQNNLLFIFSIILFVGTKIGKFLNINGVFTTIQNKREFIKKKKKIK